MRIVIQRVTQASVRVANELHSHIGPGLLVLMAVAADDTETDVDYMVNKLVNLRLFADSAGKMNLSVLDVVGEVMLVSQFTLYADCRRGRRPSFTAAAAPQLANELYELAAAAIRDKGVSVATGIFGEHMQISLVNDGPVTVLLDT